MSSRGGETTAGPVIQVTPDNVDLVASGLPFVVRQAFRFATRLALGRLEVELPDGRRLAFGGVAEGPEAKMVVKTFAFARRLISGGDLGLAEAYLRGEWERLDLEK